MDSLSLFPVPVMQLQALLTRTKIRSTRTSNDYSTTGVFLTTTFHAVWYHTWLRTPNRCNNFSSSQTHCRALTVHVLSCFFGEKNYMSYMSNYGQHETSGNCQILLLTYIALHEFLSCFHGYQTFGRVAQDVSDPQPNRLGWSLVG